MYKITIFTYESSALCLNHNITKVSPSKTTALLTKAVVLAQNSTFELRVKIREMP